MMNVATAVGFLLASACTAGSIWPDFFKGPNLAGFYESEAF